MQSSNCFSISVMDNYMLGSKGVSFIKQSLYHPLCIPCRAYNEKTLLFLAKTEQLLLYRYPGIKILLHTVKPLSVFFSVSQNLL